MTFAYGNGNQMQREAYILISTLLVCAIVTVLLATLRHANGAELTCAPRPMDRKQYWSYRLVDGRACWYPGKYVHPREALRWSAPLPAQTGQPRDEPHLVPPSSSLPVVAPVYEPSWHVLMRSTTIWFSPMPANEWRLP